MGEEDINDGQRQLQAARWFTRMLPDEAKRKSRALGEL